MNMCVAKGGGGGAGVGQLVEMFQGGFSCSNRICPHLGRNVKIASRPTQRDVTTSPLATSVAIRIAAWAITVCWTCC